MVPVIREDSEEQGRASHRSKDSHTEQLSKNQMNILNNPFDDIHHAHEEMPNFNEECESSSLLLSFTKICNQEEKQPEALQELEEDIRPDLDNISDVLNLSYRDYDFGGFRSESPIEGLPFERAEEHKKQNSQRKEM